MSVQALTESYTHYNCKMSSEKREEMIDEYNYTFLNAIKFHSKIIENAEKEIIEAALVKDWYHEAELMKLIVKKENAIEILKAKLITD